MGEATEGTLRGPGTPNEDGDHPTRTQQGQGTTSDDGEHSADDPDSGVDN